jgi:hypothetical protein
VDVEYKPTVGHYQECMLGRAARVNKVAGPKVHQKSTNNQARNLTVNVI